MVHQSRLKTATKRTTLVLVFLCLCGANIFAASETAETAVTAVAAVPAAAPVADGAVQQKPSPTPAAGISPSMDNRMPQSQQGKQYGQPGFVGEPINLNVVNADIRDILNYITDRKSV